MKRLANREKVKESRIRVINQGTVYDVTGKLRRTIRELERGEFGSVSDAVLILKAPGMVPTAFHFGTGDNDRAYRMVAVTAENLR